jgi:hypothetical protein
MWECFRAQETISTIAVTKVQLKADSVFHQSEQYKHSFSIIFNT